MFWIGVLFGIGLLTGALVPLGLWLRQRQLDEEQARLLFNKPKAGKLFACCGVPGASITGDMHPLRDKNFIKESVLGFDFYGDGATLYDQYDNYNHKVDVLSTPMLTLPLIINLSKIDGSAYRATIALCAINMRSCPNVSLAIDYPIGTISRVKAPVPSSRLDDQSLDVVVVLDVDGIRLGGCSLPTHEPYLVDLSLPRLATMVSARIISRDVLVVGEKPEYVWERDHDTHCLTLVGSLNAYDGCLHKSSLNTDGYMVFKHHFLSTPQPWLELMVAIYSNEGFCYLCGGNDMDENPSMHGKGECLFGVSRAFDNRKATLPVILVGDTRVGKSTLSDRVSRSHDRKSGSESHTFGMNWSPGEGPLASVYIYDTAGSLDTRYPEIVRVHSILNMWQLHESTTKSIVPIIVVRPKGAWRPSELPRLLGLLSLERAHIIINVESFSNWVANHLTILPSEICDSCRLITNLEVGSLLDIYEFILDAQHLAISIPPVNPKGIPEHPFTLRALELLPKEWKRTYMHYMLTSPRERQPLSRWEDSVFPLLTVYPVIQDIIDDYLLGPGPVGPGCKAAWLELHGSDTYTETSQDTIVPVITSKHSRRLGMSRGSKVPPFKNRGKVPRIHRKALRQAKLTRAIARTGFEFHMQSNTIPNEQVITDVLSQEDHWTDPKWAEYPEIKHLKRVISGFTLARSALNEMLNFPLWLECKLSDKFRDKIGPRYLPPWVLTEHVKSRIEAFWNFKDHQVESHKGCIPLNCYPNCKLVQTIPANMECSDDPNAMVFTDGNAYWASSDNVSILCYQRFKGQQIPYFNEPINFGDLLCGSWLGFENQTRFVFRCDYDFCPFIVNIARLGPQYSCILSETYYDIVPSVVMLSPLRPMNHEDIRKFIYG